MEQEGNQNHRRLPAAAVQLDNQQLQQQQPQKCPRCDSLNTKFCYYNNYSLTQPRHFCKNCRRYWTHGGTLRNVPVGGGCRKGKKAKTTAAAAGENSRSQPPPPQTPHQSEQQIQLNLTTPAIVALPPANIPASSYFSGGGFLSSLVKIQSLSQTPPNQEQINVGGGGGQFGNSSNFSLLQGMNFTSFRSQAQDQQLQNPNQEFYQMVNRDQNVELPIYPSDQGLVQPNRPIGSWNQNPLINNTNPNQWPDLPGYGPPT